MFEKSHNTDFKNIVSAVTFGKHKYAIIQEVPFNYGNTDFHFVGK